MSKTKKLIIFFAANVSLALAAVALVIFGQVLDGTQYQPFFDCPSLLMFDLYCPFCGATRSLSALLKGDIISAFIYNPAFVLFLPYFVYLDLSAFISILKKEKLPNINKVIAFSLIAILLINWIFRNTLLFFGIDYMSTMKGFIS